MSRRCSITGSAKNDFAGWLSEALEAAGWTQRELARRAGISHTSVSNVLAGRSEPTWEFCAAVAGAFNVPPEEAFRMAGLLAPLPQETRTTRQLVELIQTLGEEDRRFLLRVARGLVQVPAAEEEPRVVHAEDRLPWEIVQRLQTLPPARRAELERMIDEESRQGADDDAQAQHGVA